MKNISCHFNLFWIFFFVFFFCVFCFILALRRRTRRVLLLLLGDAENDAQTARIAIPRPR